MTPSEFPLRPTRRIDLSGRLRPPRSALDAARQRLALLLGGLGLLLVMGLLLWPWAPTEPDLPVLAVQLTPPVPSAGPPVLAPPRLPAATPAADVPAAIAPDAPAPAAAAQAPEVAERPPTLIIANDDLVPVIHVQRGGTLWDLGVARVGRNVPAVIAWIRTMQRLNGLKNPHRIQPGFLILPEPDPHNPVFMRRVDLEAR